MPTLLRVLAVLAVVSWLDIASAESDEIDRIPLAEFLESINNSGQRVIFSSGGVGDELSIPRRSATGISRQELAELLQPLSLEVRDGPSKSWLIVPVPSAVDATQSPEESDAAYEAVLPEIVVTSSLRRIRFGRVDGVTALERELAARIPAAAEETVRLPTRLPGVANGGISSRSHVRGGEENETLYLLDGLRLYEPFHLKDFQAVATTINPNAVAGMDFYSGAFPARFGDRMSAVMDISLRRPEEQIQTELALSFFNASAVSLGEFGGNDKGDWLFAARRGNLDLIADIVNPDFGSPDYRDFLAHIGWRFNDRAEISLNTLVSADKITLNDIDRGESATAEYGNNIVWAKWHAAWTDRLSSDTLLSFTDIDDIRVGVVDLPGVVSGELDDRRDFRAIAFKQDWTLVASPSWMLQFGVDAKHFDGRYRFSSIRSLEPPFEQIFANTAFEAKSADLSVDGEQYAAYVEFRWRPDEHWTMDFGMRRDQQNYTFADGDAQSSPRVSVLYQPSDRVDVRLAWGQYSQAQEVNELQVSDGSNQYYRAQRAEHVVASLKYQMAADIDLDVSYFRKSFRSVRPRFENAFDQLTLLPELQFDRVEIDADDAESSGVEVLLAGGDFDSSLYWWLGYTWSKASNNFSGRTEKRSWDQPHTGKFGISWQWRRWDFSAAGTVNTGWPKTDLQLQSSTNPDGTEALTLLTSDYNALRHSPFHTLDVRASRDFDVRIGRLNAFIEVTNLYNRQNPCCTAYSVAIDASGATVLVAKDEYWLPLIPSLGFVWSF